MRDVSRQSRAEPGQQRSESTERPVHRPRERPEPRQAGSDPRGPGDPESSYPIRKLEGRDISGTCMPQNGPPYLTSGQILVIVVAGSRLGAPNN